LSIHCRLEAEHRRVRRVYQQVKESIRACDNCADSLISILQQLLLLDDSRAIEAQTV
jgi:hypothetical protein